MMCLEVEERNFTTPAGKSALKMKEALWKNSLIVAIDV
jgi:hypothetical protein